MLALRENSKWPRFSRCLHESAIARRKGKTCGRIHRPDGGNPTHGKWGLTLTLQVSLHYPSPGNPGRSLQKSLNFFRRVRWILQKTRLLNNCIASEIPRNLAPGFTQYFSEEVGLTEAAASTITPNIHCSRTD